MRLITVVVCVLMLQTANAVWARQQSPNVIIFLVDDLGWRDLACYGSTIYETPNVDALAGRGVRFTNAYAACSVCSPTRASLLTGKYPARLGLTDWLPGRKDYPFQRLLNVQTIQHLPLSEVTLAEALKQHGYATAHFGKWHLGEEQFGPTAQGFDIQVPKWNKGWPKRGYHAPFELTGLPGKDDDYLTDRLTDEAISFIEHQKNSPFFLYLSHFAVHDPIQGRADLTRAYRQKMAKVEHSAPAYLLEDNPDDGRTLTEDDRYLHANAEQHAGFRLLPNRTVKIKQHQDNPEFASMVTAMDESLGRITDCLERMQISDNTIIVFFSDNGGMAAANFGRPNRKINPEAVDRAFSTSNLPLRGAKGWLYEGGIRVPLLVSWPGNTTGGSVCTEPVISTDLFPTILEIAGHAESTSPACSIDGHSLVPALRNQPFTRGPIYWHFPHYSNHGLQSPGGAIRLGQYKLLEYYENNSVQLFDLDSDIAEVHNLADALPRKTEELRARLHEWREEINAKMMLPNPNFDNELLPEEYAP